MSVPDRIFFKISYENGPLRPPWKPERGAPEAIAAASDELR